MQVLRVPSSNYNLNYHLWLDSDGPMASRSPGLTPSHRAQGDGSERSRCTGLTGRTAGRRSAQTGKLRHGARKHSQPGLPLTHRGILSSVHSLGRVHKQKCLQTFILMIFLSLLNPFTVTGWERGGLLWSGSAGRFPAPNTAQSPHRPPRQSLPQRQPDHPPPPEAPGGRPAHVAVARIIFHSAGHQLSQARSPVPPPWGRVLGAGNAAAGGVGSPPRARTHTGARPARFVLHFAAPLPPAHVPPFCPSWEQVSFAKEIPAQEDEGSQAGGGLSKSAF